jgi:cellulose synthase/poly-beta-1,6-N-acetylglucosamine synthase-like glycosyltransferase
MKKSMMLFLFILLILFISFSELSHVYEYQKPMVQASILFILIFSSIVIARYFILLLFSMLNLLKDAKNPKKRKTVHDKMVSVIVPCYNEEMVLKSSLQSLINQTYKNYEIIVVDDGSSDQTYLIAKSMEFTDNTKRLVAFTKPNSGKANALNFGISKAKGSLILTVDADSKLSSSAIELMTEYFDDPQIGAVAGSVYVTNQNTIWSKLQALEYIQGLNLVRNGQAYLKLVNIIPGPIGMFRKSAILEVGGYKSDTYAEDCDLTLQLINKRYKVDYAIDAISYTEAPEALTELLKQRYRWTRGILQSVLKHKNKLWKLHKNFSMSMVMWYMIFEAILWPFAFVFVNIFMIYVAVTTGYNSMFIYWWLIFTVLDLAASLYCVSVTKENIKLALYAFYYRIFFINIINIAKILATIEEFKGVKMSWGKLERKGRI